MVLTKRIPAAAAGIALALLCAFLPLAAAAGETLTIGVPTDRCPMFFLDDEGTIAGIGTDLMRAAAEEAGYTAEFRAIGEKTLKEALDNPDYDIVMPFGGPVNSSAGQASIVTENLIQTPFTLVTENQSKPKHTLNELEVGMLNSLAGAAETVHQLYPRMKIKMYATMGECVRALREGEVDALLHNSYVWSYVLQKPSYADLAVQPEAMFSMDFRAGTRDTPEGRALIERLNSGIAAITDPLRQAVTLDYTSRRLYRYDLSDYLYKYGLILLLGALLMIALAVIMYQRYQTIRAEQEEKVRHMLDHDPLTGVLSASGFRKQVEELLHEHPEIPYLLVYTNILNFKYINDSLGRDAGDELLCFWTDKTRETLSSIEAIGRIGADHIVVLRRAGGDERVHRDDEKVVNAVRNYFTDRGKDYRVRVCGGIYVLTPRDYWDVDVDHMMDLARVAEKRVRETRNDGYEFYNPEQWEKGKHVAEVINHLPAAIRNGDIQVWYQPQVNYQTGAMTGAEALCRWDHDKLGWLHPEDFIGTLEEAGLIYDLDSYVWDRVCRDLQRWNGQGIRRSVSVNVSRNDIREGEDLAEHFRKLTETYGLTPDQLRIEITETAYVENPETLIRTTEKLQAAGFRVEMDDFGSGYSSLNMLKEVPVDRIKMDLRFLTDAGQPDRGRIIISHMIRMAKSLGMEMIFEGVETADQADFLRSEGGTEMQGFFFHKPMPVEEFEKL